MFKSVRFFDIRGKSMFAYYPVHFPFNNSTVIAAVNSSHVNCSLKFKMSSEYICLKRCAISDREFKQELFNPYGLESKCIMIECIAINVLSQ